MKDCVGTAKKSIIVLNKNVFVKNSQPVVVNKIKSTSVIDKKTTTNASNAFNLPEKKVTSSNFAIKTKDPLSKDSSIPSSAKQ